MVFAADSNVGPGDPRLVQAGSIVALATARAVPATCEDSLVIRISVVSSPRGFASFQIQLQLP